MTEDERAARGWPSTARVPFRRRPLALVAQPAQEQQARAAGYADDPCDEMGVSGARDAVAFGEGDA